MLRPLKLLSAELIKRRTKSGLVARHHGIYRELLFLSFAAIGRENIDQGRFVCLIDSNPLKNVPLPLQWHSIANIG